MHGTAFPPTLVLEIDIGLHESATDAIVILGKQFASLKISAHVG
jgi:hypothetical protein